MVNAKRSSLPRGSEPMRKKITAWLDTNKDGQLTIDDVTDSPVLSHHWMLLAGLAIAVGSAGNVLEYTHINSDFFWFCAAVAAMSEYIDDIRSRRRGQ